MKHIQNEFKELLDYVCLSSFNDTQAANVLVYIQIILKKVVNKKTYFLSAIAGENGMSKQKEKHLYSVISLSFSGMQCNYHVTSDDRAWNMFLKKS